jgi:hypothetical protein
MCHLAPLLLLQYKDSFLHGYLDDVVGDRDIQNQYEFSLFYTKRQMEGDFGWRQPKADQIA